MLLLFSSDSTEASEVDGVHNIRSTSDGRVSATVEMAAGADCDVNFDNFPKDRHRCCFTLRDQLYSGLVTLLIDCLLE